tara:strand:- start:234 stop:470 length:237 start_codon:yes stop_codon:yes gene_type:complete
MDESMDKAIAFIKDYMTHYKISVNLEELREDFLLQFEDTEMGSPQFFLSVWKKLRDEKLVAMSQRNRAGQVSEYHWNG